MNHTKSGLLLLSLGFAFGCASIGYRETIATDDVSRDAFVEMVIRNRTEDVVRVSVNWEDRGGLPPLQSSRVLGDLQGGQTMTIPITYRWRRISLTVEVLRDERLGQPPVASRTADRPGLPVNGVQRGPAVEIGPGDRLQWEIMRIGDLWSIQLAAHDSPEPTTAHLPEGQTSFERRVAGDVG